MSTPPFTDWHFTRGQSHKIIFVGDLHVATDQNLRCLQQVLDISPTDVILSNLSGSAIFQIIKQLFYAIHNPAAHELHIGTPQEKTLSDEDILSHIVQDSDGATLKQRYINLISYVLRLDGNIEAEIHAALAKIPDSQMAKRIWQIAAAEYVGRDWFLSQPKKLRAAAAAQLKPNAEKFGSLIRQMVERKIRVTIMEGNLDLHSSNIHGNYGWDVEVFDAMAYYKSLGATIIRKSHAHAREEENVVIVYLPYWSFTPCHPDAEKTFIAMLDKVKKCREGKVVVVIAGCEPCWEPHYPNSPNATGSRADMINLLGNRLAQLKPDRVLYSRQASPIKDAGGNLLPASTGYILSVKNDNVILSRTVSSFAANDAIVVNFVPVGHIALLQIPRTNPLPQIFDGHGPDPIVF